MLLLSSLSWEQNSAFFCMLPFVYQLQRYIKKNSFRRLVTQPLCRVIFYRVRLLLRTPGPVPYGICKCSFVETSYTQSYITPVYDTFPWLDFSPTLTLLLNKGLHRASAMGVACRQGTLTPPDTWSRPFGTCICSTCWDQSFSELVVILPDYALRISLGTFSILLTTSPLRMRKHIHRIHLFICTNYDTIKYMVVFMELL